VSVTVTFVVVPVIPETLIVEGYNEATVGAGGFVLIVIGLVLEKTTSVESSAEATLGFIVNENINTNATADNKSVVVLEQNFVFFRMMSSGIAKRRPRRAEKTLS
jgi:hypothetical protein